MEKKDLRLHSIVVASDAMGHSDPNQFFAHCDALYGYFYENGSYTNLKDIVRDDRTGFHVGSAFYFMGMGVKDKESDKYKFSMIVSYLNLFNALSGRDIQACLAAHRLFILLAKNNTYFNTKLIALSQSLYQFLNPCPSGIHEKIREYKELAYNFLCQFIVGEGSAAFSMLNVKEQVLFQIEFDKISNRIKNNAGSIRNGYVVLNALKEELLSSISGIEYLGIVS